MPARWDGRSRSPGGPTPLEEGEGGVISQEPSHLLQPAPPGYAEHYPALPLCYVIGSAEEPQVQQAKSTFQALCAPFVRRRGLKGTMHQSNITKQHYVITNCCCGMTSVRGSQLMVGEPIVQCATTSQTEQLAHYHCPCCARDGGRGLPVVAALNGFLAQGQKQKVLVYTQRHSLPRTGLLTPKTTPTRMHRQAKHGEASIQQRGPRAPISIPPSRVWTKHEWSTVQGTPTVQQKAADCPSGRPFRQHSNTATRPRVQQMPRARPASLAHAQRASRTPREASFPLKSPLRTCVT